MSRQNLDFYRQRLAQCSAQAERTDGPARLAHLEMARLYRAKLERLEAAPAEPRAQPGIMTGEEGMEEIP